jgi:glycolate oxidase
LREGGSGEAVAAAEARMVTAKLTWKTIERIRTRSSLPVILKGISTAEDARLAVEHGGQRRSTSPITAVASSIARAAQSRCCRRLLTRVGGNAEVVMDGGIYRGTDVLKAIALGARAVCLGRLQCWALAAGGEVGLVQMLEILEEEIIIAMGLLGVTRLSDLHRDHLFATDALDPPHIFNPFPVVKERLARQAAAGATSVPLGEPNDGVSGTQQRANPSFARPLQDLDTSGQVLPARCRG